jgi:hypothetical protein
VVAAIARDMGLAVRVRHHQPSYDDRLQSQNASIWIALTADEAAMARFTAATGKADVWEAMPTRAGIPAWSDSFASVLPTLKPFWKEG